jgi:hypothetical protein
MDEARGTQWRQEKNALRILVRKPKQTEHLDNLEVNGE